MQILEIYAKVNPTILYFPFPLSPQHPAATKCGKSTGKADPKGQLPAFYTLAHISLTGFGMTRRYKGIEV
jgi:hypothetical protein